MGAPRAVFLGPDPLPALGSGLRVICADSCGLTPGPEPGMQVVALPRPHSTPALIRDRAVAGILRGSGLPIVVWKGSADVEREAAELGLRVVGPPASLSRRLENKVYFSRAATRAGLPVPETVAGRAGLELLQQARRLPLPVVFQLAQGFSGARTFGADSEVGLEALMARFAGRPCRVSRLVEGEPVTVTGVVGRERVLVGPACRQLTGVAELTPHRFGSCGNDYALPVPAQGDVLKLAQRCGEWLAQEAYRGVFGLDLVVSEGAGPVCIEVNPRLVASVPLLSLSSRDRREPGPLDHHLASFGIGEEPRSDLHCDWSQLILYQVKPRRGGVVAGTARAHLSEAGELVSLGKLDLLGPAPGELGVVVQGDSEPGRELARVILQGSILGGDGSLRPELRGLASRLRQGLEQAPPEG